jgi:DNA-binding transcriptional MerR regulator
MFKISEFSRFTRVSVKMLRHYDQIGLLRPARIDPVNSYRYYSAEQLPRLNRIIALKDLGFSLDEIDRLLDDRSHEDKIQRLFHVRQLSDASRIDLGFPRAFLDSDHVHGLIFGDTFSRIAQGK